ncbi:MAG: branched-chain amino acid aminotransferase [Thermoflexales bacterium]|nr:branched-chain amino acid aminotransferase [Thermoflexales bacterium]
MLRPFDPTLPLPPQEAGWDENLRFAYTEVDAFWLTRWTPDTGWEPGRLYEHRGATLELSPGANVLYYGQGVFEGLKAFRTRAGKIVLFRPRDNARRLRASAARLAMEPPPVDLFIEAVTAVVRANARWVPAPEKGSFYLRPVLIGTEAVLGVRPSQEYLFYVFGCPVGPYMGGNRLIVLSGVHRSAPYGTGAAKAAGNYAGCLRPQKIARDMGYIDALYLDAREDRYIEELTGANFFAILKDGTLVTPALGSILPGITRDSILTVAREVFGWIAVERRLAIDEVLNDAAEAFYVGTAAVLSPVTVIHYQGVDHPIGDGQPGPRAQTLRQALVEIQLQERPDHWGWVVEVA